MTHLLPWEAAHRPRPKHFSGRLDRALRGSLITDQASPPMVAVTVEVILQAESRRAAEI